MPCRNMKVWLIGPKVKEQKEVMWIVFCNSLLSTVQAPCSGQWVLPLTELSLPSTIACSHERIIARQSVGKFESWSPDRALPFGWGHSSGSSYSSLCHKVQSRAWQSLGEESTCRSNTHLRKGFHSWHVSFACHLVRRDMGTIKSQEIWKSETIWFSREITVLPMHHRKI